MTGHVQPKMLIFRRLFDKKHTSMGIRDDVSSSRIVKILRRIADSNAARVLAIAGSDATKVRLEPVYDRLFADVIGRKIKHLPIGIKNLVEVVAYTSHGVLEGQFDPKSPFGVFLREVVEDMPAEVGRRMLNGDLNLSPAHGRVPIEADFTVDSSILELSPDEIREITKWFEILKPEEKRQFKDILKKSSVDSLQTMIALDQESRILLLAILGPDAKPEKREYFKKALLGIKHEIDEFNAELDEVLSRKRQKRQRRRERKDGR